MFRISRYVDCAHFHGQRVCSWCYLKENKIIAYYLLENPDADTFEVKFEKHLKYRLMEDELDFGAVIFVKRNGRYQKAYVATVANDITDLDINHQQFERRFRRILRAYLESVENEGENQKVQNKSVTAKPSQKLSEYYRKVHETIGVTFAHFEISASSNSFGNVIQRDWLHLRLTDGFEEEIQGIPRLSVKYGLQIEAPSCGTTQEAFLDQGPSSDACCPKEEVTFKKLAKLQSKEDAYPNISLPNTSDNRRARKVITSRRSVNLISYEDSSPSTSFFNNSDRSYINEDLALINSHKLESDENPSPSSKLPETSHASLPSFAPLSKLAKLESNADSPPITNFRNTCVISSTPKRNASRKISETNKSFEPPSTKTTSAHQTGGADEESFQIEGDKVFFGPGRTTIKRKDWEAVRWSTVSSATRSLLRAKFPPGLLANSSLTGKISNAFLGRSNARQQLDKNITDDIIFLVSRKLDKSVSEVRKSITSCLADEHKLFYKGKSSKQNTKKVKISIVQPANAENSDSEEESEEDVDKEELLPDEKREKEEMEKFLALTIAAKEKKKLISNKTLNFEFMSSVD